MRWPWSFTRSIGLETIVSSPVMRSVSFIALGPDSPRPQLSPAL